MSTSITPAPTAGAWCCSVCGYIHRGATAPQWCPVCGAAQADFEVFQEPVVARPGTVSRWRCLNCTYVHSGSEPPGECPVCGAPRERFEAMTEARGEAAVSGKAVRVVIAGAGIAGISAAEAVRQHAPGAEVVVLSKESGPPYYRLNLTRYLAGEVTEDDLYLHPAGWYAENRIELLTGVDVTGLHPGERQLALSNGRSLPFEKLILTVGAHPFIPPMSGTALAGVTCLRTVGDADAILAAAKAGSACVCLGGGLLGLETAGALARRGADVTLLESHDWLMPRQLNRTAGEILRRHVEKAGIKLRRLAKSKEIIGSGRAAGVLLEDGVTIPAELVIVATGVRPNSYLARQAGLEVNKGIVVDNQLVGSHPDILAAGDVAEHHGQLYGSWGASQYQGAIAGMNAVGLGVEFGGLPRANSLKVLGIDLMSIGMFEPEDGSFAVVEAEEEPVYRRFLFHDGRLVGAILLGDTTCSGAVKKAMENKLDCTILLRHRPSPGEVVAFLREHAAG